MNRKENMSISSTRDYLNLIVTFTKKPSKQMLDLLKIEHEKRTIHQTVKEQPSA